MVQRLYAAVGPHERAVRAHVALVEGSGLIGPECRGDGLQARWDIVRVRDIHDRQAQDLFTGAPQDSAEFVIGPQKAAILREFRQPNSCIAEDRGELLVTKIAMPATAATNGTPTTASTHHGKPPDTFRGGGPNGAPPYIGGGGVYAPLAY